VAKGSRGSRASKLDLAGLPRRHEASRDSRFPDVAVGRSGIFKPQFDDHAIPASNVVGGRADYRLRGSGAGSLQISPSECPGNHS
jgi:hypothetical protein